MISIKSWPVPEIASEVFEGLSRRPKSLPPKLFYDATGSALFDRITELPEYYLTRTEAAILEQHAGEISERSGHNVTVIELGAGSGSKTRWILEAFSRRQLRVPYVPLDVSRAALITARATLEKSCPAVRVQPHVGDLADVSFIHATRPPRLVMYIGSSIGNLHPEEALDLLCRVRDELEPGDHLLLGTDLVKSPQIVLPAYDDAAGITAQFNKNMLARINRELGADFDLDAFRHVALWNGEASRIEMHLESLRSQVVRIDLLDWKVGFEAGEWLHTENSYKYTEEPVLTMFSQAGFEVEAAWRDSQNWFAVHLAVAAG